MVHRRYIGTWKVQVHTSTLTEIRSLHYTKYAANGKQTAKEEIVTLSQLLARVMNNRGAGHPNQNIQGKMPSKKRKSLTSSDSNGWKNHPWMRNNAISTPITLESGELEEANLPVGEERINKSLPYLSRNTLYLVDLLDKLPDICMKKVEPSLNSSEFAIVDVDAQEPNIEPDDATAVPKELPILERNLTYGMYMAQYKLVVWEELRHVLRETLSNKQHALTGSFHASRGKLTKDKQFMKLAVRIDDVSVFGDEAEYFNNVLLLLNPLTTPGICAGASSDSDSDNPAKLQYGIGNLQVREDGTGVLSIEMRPEAYRELVGELPEEGHIDASSTELQWTFLDNMTSYVRKTWACTGNAKKRPVFYKQICAEERLDWPKPPKKSKVFPHLNTKQNDAVNRLSAMSKTGILYLSGPPGTGKTAVVVEAVKDRVRKHPKKRILVVAGSNRAVQVAAEKFVQSAPEETLPFVSIAGRLDKLPNTLSHMHEKNHLTHMLAPMREVALDRESELSALVEKFNAAVTLTRKRIQRVLRSPFGDRPSYPLAAAVNALVQKKGFSSVEMLHEHNMALLKEVSEQLRSLSKSGVSVPARAQVVFATCVTSGAYVLPAGESFHTVVLDEASQTDLPEAMIPIERFKPSLWIQIGDPKQLGAFVRMKEVEQKGYKDSMIARAISGAKKSELFMLTEQYRMHPSIRKWPSDRYYDEKLTENASVLARPSPLALLPSHVPLSGLPSAFVNVPGEESGVKKNRVKKEGDTSTAVEVTYEDLQEGKGTSFCNTAEAAAIVDTVAFLLRHGVPAKSIAVISFYSAQVKLVKEMLGNIRACQGLDGSSEVADQEVYVNTVDGCQGDEYDFVLISCVRTSFHVGFLDDSRRINVAMTRAKHARWVFGNEPSLSRSGSDFCDYLEYIQNPRKNNTYPPTALLQWKAMEVLLKNVRRETENVVEEIANGAEERSEETFQGLLEGESLSGGEERASAMLDNKEPVKVKAKRGRKKKVVAENADVFPEIQNMIEEKTIVTEENKPDGEKEPVKVKATRGRKKKAVVEVVEVIPEVPIAEETIKVRASLALPETFFNNSTVDIPSTTWLADRMVKLGYAQEIVQVCHDKLVRQEGFVQESFFAELSDADFTASYLTSIGISTKGTQVFLLRLHKELRRKYLTHG